MGIEKHSTATAAPAERTAHWSGIISETYFPLRMTYRDPATFHGRLERRVSGEVALSRLRSEPAQYERMPGLIRDGSGAEEYLITLPVRAPVLFRQLGHDVTCRPGNFLVQRGDEPYRFAHDQRNDLLVMKVPRASLAERLRQPDRFCAAVVDGREDIGGLFAETVRRAHVMPEGPAAAEVLGRHLVELLALTLDGRAEVAGGASSGVRAAHLRRAQAMIAQNLPDPSLSPDAVAAACGISKRYLHDLFGDSGTTVGQFIRESRLTAARDLLQMPGSLSLAEIAYRFGFGDQAQFSRLFRERFGTTPSSYRANHACTQGGA